MLDLVCDKIPACVRHRLYYKYCILVVWLTATVYSHAFGPNQKFNLDLAIKFQFVSDIMSMINTLVVWHKVTIYPFKRQPHKMVKHTETIRPLYCRRIVWVCLAILWG